MNIDLGIIGGTGLYSPDIFHTIEEREINTPYGKPSDKIKIAKVEDKIVAFLPRHGPHHEYPPHKINCHANIYALKQLGVKRIIGVCAVGSLQEHIKPGETVLPDQYFDFTKLRKLTYYDEKPVTHISVAEPFCAQLRKIASETISGMNLPMHHFGTYVCIEGPRFSTKAESKFFRTVADIIGMTIVPEVNLAIEQEMCYLSIASVTDYDVWAERAVDVLEVIETMKKNEVNLKQILRQIILNFPSQRTCACGSSLKHAKL